MPLYHACTNDVYRQIAEAGVIHPFSPDTIKGPNKATTSDGAPVKYLLAGDDLIMAHFYALKIPGRTHRCGSAEVQDGKMVHYTILQDRDRFLEEYPGGKIIEVPTDGFRPNWLPGERPNGEWISENSVALRTCKLHDVPTIEIAMQHGGQVLFVATANDGQGITPKPLLRADFPQLIAEGILIHENQRRGINPVDFRTGQMQHTHNTDGSAISAAHTVPMYDVGQIYQGFLHTIQSAGTGTPPKNKGSRKKLRGLTDPKN